jgi:hypothetical protein
VLFLAWSDGAHFGFGVRGGGDENRKESGWVSTEIIVIKCNVGFGIS